MRDGREGFRFSHLDLFAWRERDGNSAETVAHGGRLRDALEPNRTEPQDVAAITPEALHSALDSRFDGPTGKNRDLVPLIAEVERRREATAAPFWCACVAATPASIDRAPFLKWSPR